MKKIVVLLFLSVFTFACEKKEKILVVGTNDGFPPFSYIEDYKHIGFDIEFARIIAENYGAKLEVRVMPFANLIDAVYNGEIDMALCSITITEGRRLLVDFSYPYYEAAQVAVVRIDDVDSFADIRTQYELGEQKNLAAQMGTTGAATAREIAGHRTVLEFPSWEESLEELHNGNVDAAIIDRDSARAFITKDDRFFELPIPFYAEHYGAALKKGNTELTKVINDTINELVNSGEYNKMLEEHIISYLEHE